MPALTVDLVREYCLTAYCAQTPAGRLCLRVGRTHEALDAFLAESGLATWAFITACNPYSRPLPPAENQARHARLSEAVRAAGYAAWPGEGSGRDPAWKPEPSLLIGGVSRPSACALGRQFAQHALVFGRRGEPAELVFLGGREIIPVLRAALGCDDEGVKWTAG